MSSFLRICYSLLLASVALLQSCMFIGKTPKRYLATADRHKPLDAIIVPGIPYKNNGWEGLMRSRVLWSYILYKNGYTKNVIYSGGAVHTPYKEAVIMGMYAQELGIPKEHIFYDTAAKHTKENIYYSYLVAKENGFKSIGLATDKYQLKTYYFFVSRRFSSPICLLPVVSDSIRAYEFVAPVIDPEPAKVENFTSLREQQTFWERFKASNGWNIDWCNSKERRLEEL